MDINILKAYQIDMPKFWLKYGLRRVQEFKSFDDWFQNKLSWIDCTKIGEDGLRYKQTINISYNNEITEAIYCIEHTNDIDKEHYYKLLLEQHQKNIEFEKLNPPIIYGNRKQKKATKERVEKQRLKQSKIDFGNEVPKMTAAERKLKAKAEKLSKLSVIIKPVC